MNQRILIVEDEPELVNILRDYLTKAGFQVEIAFDGRAAVSRFQHFQPDLVLLDLNLPGQDGLGVAREIRRESQVPIIMVTARVEEADRVIGLELGADDYVTKPFSPRELVARIRAVLRRAGQKPPGEEIFRRGELEIDVFRHRARRGGSDLNLTPTEFSILATMAAEPGRAFSRMQLLTATQGESYEGYERTIDAHIKNLRAKIEDNPKEPAVIETVYGIGYRFSEEF